MEAFSTKPTDATGGRFPADKVQNLPLLCVEAICKFTPTSKLVRLYSTAVPLPGAIWNLGLEVVLKKRLPLSLSKDHSRSQSEDTRVDALFDSSGAKVATIKHPEAFQFSPLCEFVERAAVPFRVISVLTTPDAGQRVATERRLVISGQPLLPFLPSISQLTVTGVGNFKGRSLWKNSENRELLIPALKKVLPQLEVFEVEKWHEEKRELLDATLIEMLPEMTALKQLDIYFPTFETLMRKATNSECFGRSTNSESLRRVLSGLNTVQLRYENSAIGAPQVLSFLPDCCAQLTHLSLMVEGQLKPYLVALRALLSLNTLGVEIGHVRTKGMSFGEDEVVRSVLDLRLLYKHRYWMTEKVAIASLFPSVKTVALCLETFTVELCEKKVWSQLETLSCFAGYYRNDVSSIGQFLATPNLPPIVDLSSVSEEKLARNSGVLTAIYQAMQRGPVKSLLLRGPMHHGALSRLQSHIDLNGERAKVTAWKDRDLGEQMSNFAVPVSEYTDFRVVGSKENGGDFSIRVVHQFAKKKEIFD